MTRLARFVALLLLPVMIACDDDDGSGPSNGNVTGTYTLRTVDGQNLPFTLVNVPGYRLEVTADQYTLNSGGTFTTTATFRETEGTTVTPSTETYSGTWVQNGSTVNLNSEDGGPETAAFSGGNTLTFIAAGHTAVYRK
jgi:hypothetical protein